MNKKVDILNFEFSTRRIRDIGISEPILSYLELKYNLITKRFWVLDNFPKIIDRENPRMIIMANGIGTLEHFEIVKYAKNKGIKVYTMVSEGDMVDQKENVEILFWGNNTEKKMYEDINFQWSEKNIDLIHKYIDKEKKLNIVLSGGTGFDRYLFLPMMLKDYFLKKYQLGNKYSKVVGLAGFPFYFFLSDIYKKNGEWQNMHLDIEACEIMASLKDEVKKMYDELIKRNPDILFILKYHPMEQFKELSEFYNLSNYPNTKEILMEETIENIISVCDLWIAFESTTCLEAWLLEKQTIIVNPLNKKFIRSKVSEGSPFATTNIELNNMIKEFYTNSTIKKFEELKDKRDEIIKYVIGFGDGLNHVRAADIIYNDSLNTYPQLTTNLIENKRIKAKHNKKYFRKKIRALIYKTPLVFLPSINKKYIFEKDRNLEFDYSKREDFRSMYFQAIKKFHEN